MFKRPDNIRKKQASDESNTTLQGIDEKNKTVIKHGSDKRKLIKSRSEVEMNRITLS